MADVRVQPQFQVVFLFVLTTLVSCDIFVHHGHYPSDYCEFTDVILSMDRQTFFYKPGSEIDIQQCNAVKSMWPLEPIDFLLESGTCDNVYDFGHIFSIYYYYGSNYFHLHADMLIPLYSAVYWRPHKDQFVHAFLPSVETTRTQIMDWVTPAFMDESKYWVQMIKSLAGNHVYLPLDGRASYHGLTVCFRRAFFGTPSVNFEDKEFISGFVKHIQESLNVTVKQHVQHRAGIITRSDRRRILNEKELLEAVREILPADRVDFSGMTFQSQVALMQNYTVLIGMNGAGLTNGLYLPPGGVVIQLVPSFLDLNNREFGVLLRGGGGGGYLEWKNSVENNTINGRGDTFVDCSEVVELVRKAVVMYDQAQPNQFNDEL